MTNGADSQQPTEKPEAQSGSEVPLTVATPSKHDVSADPNERDGHQSTAKELAREFRWIEFFQLSINGALAIIGIFALCIYSGQLKVMQGQLDEMKNSSRTVAILPVG